MLTRFGTCDRVHPDPFGPAQLQGINASNNAATRLSCSRRRSVIHAIGIWNELILANVYLTNEDLYPITKGLIVFEGVYGSDWPKLAAAVLMLMFPMLVLFMFLQRYIISGLTAGAVKG